MKPTRESRYRRAHDLDSWRTDARIAERGFVHAWESVVDDGNGEDLFLDILDEYLTPDSDVLDLGCGHGEFTLSVARVAHSVVGIERSEDYLALAAELQAEAGVTNVRFVSAELAGPDEDHPGGPIALPDAAVDLVVDRRGPPLRRYLDDLQRVARPGAVLVGIHPTGNAPAPTWIDDLPSVAEQLWSLPYSEVAAWVTDPLRDHGIEDYRLWWVDVPEYVASPRALYDRICRDQTPPWPTVRDELEDAFVKNQEGGSVVLRHQRLVWTAQLP